MKFSTVAILGSGEDFCGKLPTVGEVVTDARPAGFCCMCAARIGEEAATDDTCPVPAV